MEDVIAFIEAKGLHRFHGRGGSMGMRVKATGKYPGLFAKCTPVVIGHLSSQPQQTWYGSRLEWRSITGNT